MQTIKVIQNNSKNEFEQEIQKYLNKGYEISSTFCGFVNSDAYDFCDVWQAILIQNIKIQETNLNNKKSKRKCLYCGKDISHKDHKAKFCSNKGYGNCKDAYHNGNNPRGYGLEREEDDLNYAEGMDYLSSCGDK